MYTHEYKRHQDQHKMILSSLLLVFLGKNIQTHLKNRISSSSEALLVRSYHAHLWGVLRAGREIWLSKRRSLLQWYLISKQNSILSNPTPPLASNRSSPNVEKNTTSPIWNVDRTWPPHLRWEAVETLRAMTPVLTAAAARTRRACITSQTAAHAHVCHYFSAHKAKFATLATLMLAPRPNLGSLHPPSTMR